MKDERGRTPFRDRRRIVAAGLAFVLVLLPACRQQMAEQPRYDPLAASRFFDDGRSAREPVPGTLARGQEWDDVHLLTGRKPGIAFPPVPSLDRAADYEDTFPFPVTDAVMQRGRERYDIFCSACHDTLGTGRGKVVVAGYPPAQSFHTDRLRQAPAGYMFDVITHGYRAMPRFASQITPRDRWAVIAYVRALQLSQHARVEDLPEDLRRRLPGN